MLGFDRPWSDSCGCVGPISHRLASEVDFIRHVQLPKTFASSSPVHPLDMQLLTKIL